MIVNIKSIRIEMTTITNKYYIIELETAQLMATIVYSVENIVN